MNYVGETKKLLISSTPEISVGVTEQLYRVCWAKELSNFESLIRGALAKQDATNPAIRQAIYKSSRNALQKLIDNNRNMTVEMALKQRKSLEAAIDLIEDEIVNPAPPPPPEPPEVPAPSSNIDLEAPEPVSVAPRKLSEDPLQELKEILSVSDPVAPTPEPQSPVVEEIDEPDDGDTYALDDSVEHNSNVELDTGPAQLNTDLNEDMIVENDHELPQGFSNRRKKQRWFTSIIIFLVILSLIGWIGYRLYVSFLDGSLIGFNPNSNSATESNTGQSSADYITILEPSDLTALETDGRGIVELVTQQNIEIVRMYSIRDSNNRNEPADPILLRLEPGVLEQVSGKTVTIELFAKSGGDGPAQFTVQCDFGDAGNCGRKRFRVGLQPEASVFAFEFGQISNLDQDMFIAINTDTTVNAAITGDGDVLDLIYARLRVN